MTVRELVTDLRRRGIQLWHDGERLHYKAAKGVLTPQVLDQLRHRKADIITHLGTRRPDLATPIVARGDGSQPLSFAQERLWFLHQFEDDANAPGAAYNVPAALRLRGPLDVSALERSLNAIVQRHAILRTRFFAEGERAMQQAAPLQPIHLLAEDIHESQLAARIQREAAHHFDLAAGQLVRFSLLRIAVDDQVLVTVLHHLVTDGWSMGVMLRELAAIYGRKQQLPELPVQYADFAAHQRETLTDAALQADLAFWKTQLHDAPPVIELATDFPRPATQSYRGDVLRFELDAALSRALKTVAQQHDASVFMVLLAAFAVLLHRYSGQSGIVIGTPVANRDRREIEELIGIFSNYIPLHVDLSGNPSFREVLARVRRLSLAAYGHQHVPFEKLVEALKPERTLGASPLFQVALVLQNLPPSPLTLPGLAVEQLPVDRTTAKLDLSMLLEETADGISGELEFCIDLFHEETARQLSVHFEQLLRAVVADASVSIASAPLLTLAEQHQLETWSGSTRIENIASTLRDEFAAQVARTPDAIALVAETERLTYRDLHARACQLAHHLRASGVIAEERIAVCLPRTANLIVAILGILEAGAAYVPIDPAHPADRLSGIVTRANARIVITTPALSAKFPRTQHLVDLDALPTHSTTSPNIDIDPDALAYVIYTSGSTGVPKGVMVPHRSACSLVRALENAIYQSFPANTQPLQIALCAATAFDASVQQIFAALLLGHTLHIVPDDIKRDGASLLAFFHREQIALTDCTPSLLALLVEAGLGHEPSPLRHILVGGEALPRELVERLHERVQERVTITNVYGPTECGVDNTAFTAQGSSTSQQATIPIGAPLTNSRVYVLDALFAPLPAGVPGDLWIAGPCLARGYLGDAAQTAAAYRPDPFVAGERMYCSGDRARWLRSGDLEFLGRSDQQVKIRGYRIELAEIEATLRAAEGMTDAAVIVEEERLVAYIVVDASLPTVAVLRDQLEKQLPPYMIPASFRTLPRLPLNGSGKLDRAALRAQSVELQQGIGYVIPRDDRERALAAAWSGVLGRERVGADDHFFALGGDSIKALQVVARLRPQGWKLDIRDLFLHSTLSTLAPHLQHVAARAERAAEGGEAVLGPAQSWFLTDYAGAKQHFHQALLLEPQRPLDVAAFDAALAAVWRQHEALRMHFVHRDGRWTQSSTTEGERPRLQVIELPDNAALQAHATRLQAATNLAEGPLLLAALYRVAERELLLLAAHHLVVDGVSWRILLEDLGTAYAGADLPPPTDSFRQWSTSIATFAAHDAARDLEHWRSVERECGAVRVDHPAAPQFQRARAEHVIELSREHTHALLTDAHAAYGTRIDDLLLTGLARALAPIATASRTRILLESHGRQPLSDVIDVSRTVGWFTARYPLVLETNTSCDLARQLKQTKETLRAVPHHGISYEALRYGGGRREISAPAPQVAFNYLGQLGDDLASAHWRWLREPAGASVDRNAPLLHDLELLGLIADGRLRLSIIYSAERFAAGTITGFGERLQTQLAAIIDHTRHSADRALTPSDIDYDGFDIDALDRFLENL